MNNLYAFKTNQVMFIAERNWKAARNLLFHTPGFENAALTDMKGHIVNKQCTERVGIIKLEDVYETLPWWECKCGNRSFLPLDDGTSCRCKCCGREMRITI